MKDNDQSDHYATWQHYYDTVAALDDGIHQTARFDCTPLQFNALLNDIRAKLQLKGSETLLDVGCGNGLIDMTLSPHCHRVVGADLSLGLLRRAGRAAQLDLSWACANATRLPFSDNSVDKSMTYGVSLHFSKADLATVIKEMVRVTKPGGVVFVGDNPSPDRWQRVEQANGRWQQFKLHCRQNPNAESFLPLRVAWFLFRNKIERKRQFARMPELKSHEPAYDLAGDTEEFQESELLEMAASAGGKGRILEQNFRVPYARWRFDLLIDVPQR